ncbi:MAG: TIGR01777 family oxidoreductase, partial [Beutenbergiaceae bacterium]
MSTDNAACAARGIGEGQIVRILLAGGTGMIGTVVQRAAQRAGHEVALLVRTDPPGERQWAWDPIAGLVPAAAIEWADAVVNLAGASIGKMPWTRRYRGELVHSRIDATDTLARAITLAQQPPQVLVNASAVGYYGNRPGELLDESSDPGQGFLSYLTRRWEATAQTAATSTRVVMLRTGLVLGGTGALAPMMLTTKNFLGARIGPGTQLWPWIALDDVVGAILHLIEQPVVGPVNLVAPVATSSAEVTGALAHAMARPHALRLPAGLLRLALGPAADEMLLLSQQITPAALNDSGYRFQFLDVRDAVEVAVTGRAGTLYLPPEPQVPEPPAP